MESLDVLPESSGGTQRLKKRSGDGVFMIQGSTQPVQVDDLGSKLQALSRVLSRIPLPGEGSQGAREAPATSLGYPPPHTTQVFTEPSPLELCLLTAWEA